MFFFSRKLTLGLFTGLLGLVITLAPGGVDLEEAAGLDLFFKWRGVRQVPPEVMIVSVDRKSSDHFNVPNRSERWPRFLHARLVEKLAREKAAVIVFDITFSEPRSAEDDLAFADAVAKARNVVLTGYLQREVAPLNDKTGDFLGEMSKEKVIPPIPLLEQSAVALAPFPLHKVPIQVTQYWTFKTGAGNMPTLPVVAFQVFARDVCDDLIRLLEKTGSPHAARLPGSGHELIALRHVERFVEALREIFEAEPLLADKIRRELQDRESVPDTERTNRLLRSVIKMYRSPGSQYLNFYGPPHTIPTVPYYEALQADPGPAGEEKPSRFAGKAVFVGVSERTQPEQKDNFYTVYSQPNGLDLSGVEIAATAFANLLEDSPVRPLPAHLHLALLFLWGCVMGTLCQWVSPAPAAAIGIGLSTAYFAFASSRFNAVGGWYPIVVPLCIQTPVAFFGSVLWKYVSTHKEREHFRRVLLRYLPDRVIDHVLKNAADSALEVQTVYGICLYTDGEKYTSIAEDADTRGLRLFMNRYYEVLFTQVKQHGGIISDITGDSMMALWVNPGPDPLLREQACLAAVDIEASIHRFNRLHPRTMRLPTRIGLHCGEISLGELGAVDHYEYRPMGDVVNTASRIQNLNKDLGTKVLASGEILKQLDGFLIRELGTFILRGKSKPLVIYELIARLSESTEHQRALCAVFAEALDAYRRQSWTEALEKFDECIRIREKDGPSLFYINVCERYRKDPPKEFADGTIRMSKEPQDISIPFDVSNVTS